MAVTKEDLDKAVDHHVAHVGHTAGVGCSPDEAKAKLNEIWDRLMAKALPWWEVAGKIAAIITMIFQGQSVQQIVDAIVALLKPTSA